MAEEGIRLRSWLTFLGLTEIIEPLLETKRMPVASSSFRATEFTRRDWPIAVDRNNFDCSPSIVQEGWRERTSLNLAGFTLAYNKARLTLGKQVTVITAAQKYAYAAQIALPANLPHSGGGVVAIDAHVSPGGRVSFGVLSKDRSKFLGQTVVRGQDMINDKTHYVIVPAWDQAGILMVSNAQERDGVASQVIIRKIELFLE